MNELIFQGSATICEIIAVKNAQFITDRHDYSPESNNVFIIFPNERRDYCDGLQFGFYSHGEQKIDIILPPKKLLSFLDLLKKFSQQLPANIINQNPAVISSPFFELVSFITRADRFGTIGHITSKKLADDFESYQQEFLNYSQQLAVLTEREESLSIYCQLGKAFEFASDDGVVVFT